MVITLQKYIFLKKGADMNFVKKEPKIMAQEVATDIRRAITDGMIKPGERINETQIAKDMGISRSPVREALHMLKKEGVVVSIPYKGTFVNLLGQKDIEDMSIIRGLLEAYAIEKVIENKNEKSLECLRKNVEDIEKDVEKNN